MQLVLALYPTFLASHFPQVADFLLGRPRSAKVSVSKKILNWLSNVGWLNWLAGSLLVFCLTLVLLWWGPAAFYTFLPVTSHKEVATSELPGEKLVVSNSGTVASPSAQVVAAYLPPFEATLPTGDWLVIPRIGVRSELQATSTADSALDTGLWLVPDFGQPGDSDQPIIVVGHRFGWKWWWQNDYWKYHSFYLLPELELGDRVEIIAQQRKWTYEIYASEEGPAISDYQADLILYTCKYLSSPVRIFKYARLIDPTANSQVGK